MFHEHELYGTNSFVLRVKQMLKERKGKAKKVMKMLSA